MQSALSPIFVEHEIDASLGGADLKRIAKADDGHTYAMKRMEDHPALPLCEWVGYHLCRSTGVRTPDFAVLHYRDATAPAFGSRMVLRPNEMAASPSSFDIASFFRSHLATIARIYPLDAFLTNQDRHGRNFLAVQEAGGESLLAIDFSRAWVRFGQPFGNTEALRDSQTSKWWRYFKERLQVTPDLRPLECVTQLPDNWMDRVIESAPAEWAACIDVAATCRYWKEQRIPDRIDFVKRWL